MPGERPPFGSSRVAPGYQQCSAEDCGVGVDQMICFVKSGPLDLSVLSVSLVLTFLGPSSTHGTLVDDWTLRVR